MNIKIGIYFVWCPDCRNSTFINTGSKEINGIKLDKFRCRMCGTDLLVNENESSATYEKEGAIYEHQKGAASDELQSAIREKKIGVCFND